MAIQAKDHRRYRSVGHKSQLLPTTRDKWRIGIGEAGRVTVKGAVKRRLPRFNTHAKRITNSSGSVFLRVDRVVS